MKDQGYMVCIWQSGTWQACGLLILQNTMAVYF
jgi:hypothetical protein